MLKRFHAQLYAGVLFSVLYTNVFSTENAIAQNEQRQDEQLQNENAQQSESFFSYQPEHANHQRTVIASHLNRNPLATIHSLPGFYGAQNLGQGEFFVGAEFNLTNEYRSTVKDNERAVFDYESNQLMFDLRYGLAENLDVGARMSFIRYGGGFMDDIIEEWHDWFGLPNAGRELVPQDRAQIIYEKDGQRKIAHGHENGFGDLTLYAGKSLWQGERHQNKFWLSFKLPTGDEDELLGSGGYNLSLSNDGQFDFSSSSIFRRFQGMYSLSASYLFDADVLDQQQEDVVFSVMGGLQYAITQKLALGTQLQWNSQIYDKTALAVIEAEGGVLDVHVNYQATENQALRFGFTEDLIETDGTPDFGLTFAWQWE